MNPPPRGTGAAPPLEGPLSVAFFCPSWPPGNDPNGVVPYVGTIIPELQARGHVTSVLSPYVAHDSGAVGIYDLDAYRAGRTLLDRLLGRLASRSGRDRLLARAVCRSLVAATRRAISERGVQLLEMEETFGWCLRVRRKLSIPLVVRLHGPWFLNGPANGHPADAAAHARIRREGWAIRAADGVTAPSRDVLERTRSYYGLALEHAEVIPPPLPNIPASEGWAPAESEPHVILFIGRFDLHKGGDIIIDAFARVVERIPQARLRFVGLDRGISDKAGRRWTIRDYTDDRIPGAWQSGRVEWLGHQPHSALAGFRRKAAVTVVCSRYETFGLTATEAMAQGCPLVATHAGALPEIIQDGVNGLLCRPDDPGDLAAKLCLLLNDPAQAERLGRRAAADCQRRYNPGFLAARSADYYRRVLARSRTRHHTI